MPHIYPYTVADQRAIDTPVEDGAPEPDGYSATITAPGTSHEVSLTV